MKISVSQKMLEFLTANADKPWTIGAVAENTGLNKTQVSGAANTLANKFPDQFKREGFGIYRWLSKPTKDGNTITLEILTTRGDRLICIDTHGTIYTVDPIKGV